MARFTDPDLVQGAFGPWLQSGERVLYTAYGVRRPHLLSVLARKYLVALTDRGRFLVLHIGRRLKVKEASEYFIGSVIGVAVSTGAVATQIQIRQPYRSFSATFPRLGTPWNRLHATAIARSLERRHITALGAD